MDSVFLSILTKLLPLYLYAFLGFVAGKFLGVDRKSIAKILLYIIVPSVFFLSVLDANLTPARLGMPFVFLLVAAFISLGFYNTVGKRWKSPTKNILSFMVGSGNTGYFGLPAIAAIWGPERIPYAILVIFGYVIFEFSIGFYLTARGHHTVRDSIKRVLKLPAAYAFVAAVVLNKLGFSRGEFLNAVYDNFTAAYSILGLMMVGLGVSKASFEHFDWKFIFTTIAFKFLVWPLVMGAFIFADKSFLGFYTYQDYEILMLMSVVPLAANGVVIATELRAEPEKAAICILLTTLIALFLIPSALPWMLTLI